MVDSRKLNYKIGDILYHDFGAQVIIIFDKNDNRSTYCVAEKNGLEYWISTSDVCPKIKNNKLNLKLYKNEIYKIEDEWLILKNT